MIKKISVVACCIITFALICNSCRTTKKSGSSTEEYHSSIKNERARFAEILKQEKTYTSFSAKVNISATLKEKSFSSNATLKIEKDKVIQISIQPFLGIEIVKIFITPDRIVVIDKLKKRYVEESLSDHAESLPFDIQLSNFEALFLNRLFIPGEKEITKADDRQFEYESDKNDKLNLSLKKARRGIRNYFTINSENKIEKSGISEENQRLTLVWAYRQFDPILNIPKQATIRLQDKEGLSQGEATLSFSRIEWNNTKKIELDVPSQYSKVSIKTFLNTLF